jgi:hypothetical protein
MGLMDTLNAFLPYIMTFVMIFLIYMLVRRLMGNMAKLPQQLPPSTTGDRLKKYLFNSRKGNPKSVKHLYMKRSPFNPGGFIGYCSGALPTRYCTRFIFKQHWWQRWNLQLMYCPTTMHTSLHSQDVMIAGVGLDNAGGFYYPIPDDEQKNYDVFRIISDAVKIDLKKMQIIDTMQVEYDQVMNAIAGRETTDEFITGAPEEMVQKQQAPTPSQEVTVEETQ